MNSRFALSSYNASNTNRQGTKQYILFTWTRCKQCQELKRNLNSYIQSGRIVEYDLDNLSKRPDLMTLFNRVSPSRNVPAMAVLNGGMLERSLVGVAQIMSIL